jgi:hypothetical protein
MKKRIISIIMVVSLFAVLYARVPVNAVFFQDTATHWASDIIDTWSNHGIIQGDSNNQFFPDEYIRRVDLALIISRVMGFKEDSSAYFKDLDGLTTEQRSAILRLNKAGIMLGSNGYMRPMDYISREETAVMFGRMIRMDGSVSQGAYFSDMHTVSDWAYGMVSSMGNKGYMKGRPNGRFDPKKNITRAEVIQIMDNIVNGYYGKAGSYSVSTLGNVIINTSGVELRQVVITGDLFITDAVGSGTVTLTDVTVKGNVYVLGGSNLKLQGNTRLENVYHEKVEDKAFKYTASPPAFIANLHSKKISSPIAYEGPLGNMYLSDANKTVELKNATLNNLFVNAPGITLKADINTSIGTARVNFLFQMLGEGIISNTHIATAANGSTFERQPKSAVLPSGTTIFMSGETYKNNSNRNQTIRAVEDNISPTVIHASLTAANLTTDGATFSWKSASDNISTDKKLRYALFYSTSPYMSSVSYIETNGTMLTNYFSGKLSATVSGLKPGQVYYFNVIVKDEADNKSCYAPFTLKVGKDIDPPVPTSPYISKTYIKSDEVRLDWERATDNVTNQSMLLYTLYQSETNNIRTVEECEKNGKVIMRSKADANSYTVTKIKQSQSYYFNVVVQDEAGNKACYQMVSLERDNIPPYPESSIIKTSGLKGNQVTLSWTKATDNLTEQANLKYTVYISETNNIGTVRDCENNGKVIMKSTANRDTYTAKGLKELNLYYFNVVVQDEAGNKTCYTPVSVIPVKDTVEPAPPKDADIKVFSTSIDSARLIWNAASDNVTESAALKYSVYYSDTDNILTVSQILKNGKRLLSPTEGRLFFDFIQPKDSTGENYINVIVEDEAGNMSCYNMLKLTLGEDTTPPDIPDRTLRLTAWSQTSASISWLPANDLTGGRIGSAVSELSYSLYYMPAEGDPTDFDEVSEIESRAIWNSEFTRNITSMTVNGLKTETKYYFNVIVRDKAGLKNCYAPILVITDDTPPNVSASTINIEPDPQNERKLKITWGYAQDTYTSQKNLKYALYWSTTEYESIADIENKAHSLSKDGMVYYPYVAEGLEHEVYYEVSYYFYVIVVDEAGNKAKYQTKHFILKDTVPPVITNPETSWNILSYNEETDEYMIRINWPVLAYDEVTTGPLMYLIYSSPEKYDSLEQLLSSDTPVLNKGRNMTYYDHSNLSEGIYYYYVVVQDDAGNMAMYDPCKVELSS